MIQWRNSVMSDSPQAAQVAAAQAARARDEATLVREAKAGSYPAFEELVNRYEKKIYRLGLNITGSPEDAEDVLQETFLKAYQHLPDFREDSRFYTWLVRIGVNEGLMKLRRRRADKTVPMDDPAVDEEGAAMPGSLRIGSPIPNSFWRSRSCGKFWITPRVRCRPFSAPCFSCATWKGCRRRKRPSCWT